MSDGTMVVGVGSAIALAGALVVFAVEKPYALDAHVTSSTMFSIRAAFARGRDAAAPTDFPDPFLVVLPTYLPVEL